MNEEIEVLLEKIRINSVILAEIHRKSFYQYKTISKYFDIPIIIISVLSSSFSVGSQSYLNQQTISTTTCSISMTVAVLSSIKIYLNLEQSLKLEQEMSKSFNLLSLDVFKYKHLKVEDRSMDAISYLNKVYSNYTHLVEKSNLLRKKLKRDELCEVDNIKAYLSDTSSNTSTEV